MPDAGLESRTDEALAALAGTDVEAEGVLLSRYLRLIRFYAGRYALNGDVDDLVQEGLIALLAAIPQYDPSQGKRFSAFAQVCICNRMRSFVRRELRVPAPAEEYLPIWRRKESSLTLIRRKASSSKRRAMNRPGCR